MNAMIDRVRFLHRCLRYRWRTERLQLATIAALRLDGETVVDIGANRGIYCFWLARAIGPGGRLLAVEPQPELAAALDDLARQWGWQGFSVHAVGLSDSQGTLGLARSRIGDGSATLDRLARGGRESGSRALEIVDVPVMTLDTLLADAGAAPAFIKCDVEGHELSVLNGAMATIERHRPLLQIEVRADDARTGEIIERLAPLGYRGVMMLDGRYHDWRAYARVPSRRFGLIGHRDLLCFVPEIARLRFPSALEQRLTAASLPAGTS